MFGAALPPFFTVGLLESFNVTQRIRRLICSEKDSEWAKSKAPANHAAAESRVDDAAAGRNPLLTSLRNGMAQPTSRGACYDVGSAILRLSPYSHLMPVVQRLYEPTVHLIDTWRCTRLASRRLWETSPLEIAGFAGVFQLWLERWPKRVGEA